MWCLHQMAAPCREPGSRLLSSLNKSSWGGHGASAVPAAMPWAPAPALLAAQGGVWQSQAGTAPLACRAPILPSPAPTHSWLCSESFSSDTKPVGRPSSQRAQGTAWAGFAQVNKSSRMRQERPGWCWCLTHQTQLCPSPVFQFSEQDSTMPTPESKTASQTQPNPIAPYAGIHLGQHTSPVVCPLIQPAFLQPGFCFPFPHTFQHHSSEKMMRKPLSFLK